MTENETEKWKKNEYYAKGEDSDFIEEEKEAVKLQNKRLQRMIDFNLVNSVEQLNSDNESNNDDYQDDVDDYTINKSGLRRDNAMIKKIFKDKSNIINNLLENSDDENSPQNKRMQKDYKDITKKEHKNQCSLFGSKKRYDKESKLIDKESKQDKYLQKPNSAYAFLNKKRIELGANSGLYVEESNGENNIVENENIRDSDSENYNEQEDDELYDNDDEEEDSYDNSPDLNLKEKHHHYYEKDLLNKKLQENKILKGIAIMDKKNKDMIEKANKALSKGKGMFRKRKPKQGNARLMNKGKFQKKDKIRKNYVKEYTEAPLVYTGEATGIRRDLSRSVKFK